MYLVQNLLTILHFPWLKSKKQPSQDIRIAIVMKSNHAVLSAVIWVLFS